MGLENLCEVHQPLQHNDFIFVLEFYSWERDWEVSALTGGLKIGNGNGDWKRLIIPNIRVVTTVSTCRSVDEFKTVFKSKGRGIVFMTLEHGGHERGL